MQIVMVLPISPFEEKRLDCLYFSLFHTSFKGVEDMFPFPKLKERNIKDAFKFTLIFTMLSFLLFVSYLVHSKIIPSIVLTQEEKQILKGAQKKTFKFMKERGLGQIRELQKNLNKEGFALFISRTGKKFLTLKSWFNESSLLLALLGILLVALILFSYYQKHFSFYLFIFSVFIALWWLLGSTDDWYRYFFLAEWMFSLGIVSLIPILAKKENRIASVSIVIAVIMLFAPQFSFSSIKTNLDDTDSKNLMLMKTYLQNIDERNIFVYGWFQCPQLMLLTNKRFQDYTNEEKLSQAGKGDKEIFLLTTAENMIVEEEMKEVTKNCELIKAYGNNKLYRIRFLQQ